MKNERGFTLVELMIVLLIFCMTTTLFARNILGRTKKTADIDAVKSLVNMAARRSVVEAKHFGVHFDSTLHTAGLFEDRNTDDLYNGTDTLCSLAKLYPLSQLRIATTAAVSMTDICFKKNGATSSGNSFELKYVGEAGDTSTMQIIAASGRLLGP